MLWKIVEPNYQANPILARALDIFFILHADHEQACSVNVMRCVGSAHADPFVSVAAGAAALSGPPARSSQ
jgi:citrate synthase